MSVINGSLRCTSRVMVPLFLAGLLLVGNCASVFGKGSVLGSPHNLSARGPATGLHSQQEERVCIFCHAPHGAQPGTALWNHELPSNAGYTPYGSTTLQASVSPVPTGSSRVCLSCHDGTIALSSFNGSLVTDLPALAGGSAANLTRNLSADHPVSFVYDTTLATKKQNTLVPPQSLSPSVKLDRNGSLECTACHDPHDNEYGNFLVLSNIGPGSPLCISCHSYPGWSAASQPHFLASRPMSVGNPVTVTGCINCHSPHNAAKPQRLLDYVNEEDNCIKSCHNKVPKDIATLFTKVYRHPVEATNMVHDENESLPAIAYHVECVDCHNPHRSNGSGSPLAAPPSVNGPLLGVRKDNQWVSATNEYDICFKCHSGGNAWRFAGVSNQRIKRAITEPDLQRCFDSNNPSMHPVVNQRTTTKGAASLFTGVNTLMSTTNRIYCSDCHGNDQGTKAGGTGPNGPHASIYEHILIARYDLPVTPQGYSDVMYDLCYRCHSLNYIMGGSSGFTLGTGDNEHARHVQQRGIPCFACHDPHGVPFNPSDLSAPKGTVANNAHLINFSMDYASDGPSGKVPNPVYQTSTPAAGGSGSCMVSCHTANACNTHSYPVDNGCAAKPVSLSVFPKRMLGRPPLK